MKRYIIKFFKHGGLTATYKIQDCYDSVVNWAKIKCAMQCYDNYEILPV
jgi:hypothetical protein